jgi:hypothetical protein
MNDTPSTQVEYRDIPGYENDYKISNVGTLCRIVNGQLIPIKNHNDGNYLFIALSKNGKRKQISVHRAVALAFLGNGHCPHCLGAYTVNHKDGNPYNNHVGNLEYITQASNSKTKTSTQRHSQNSPTRKLSEENVKEIKRMLKDKIKGTTIAKQFSITPSTICDINKGRLWNHVILE